jgi:hypothetical protein
MYIHVHVYQGYSTTHMSRLVFLVRGARGQARPKSVTTADTGHINAI